MRAIADILSAIVTDSTLHFHAEDDARAWEYDEEDDEKGGAQEGRG